MSRSWKTGTMKPAGKRLRKAQRMAVTDEKHGAEDYFDLAEKEAAIGHISHAEIYTAHAADELRHKRQDQRIVNADKKRR